MRRSTNFPHRPRPPERRKENYVPPLIHTHTHAHTHTHSHHTQTCTRTDTHAHHTQACKRTCTSHTYMHAHTRTHTPHTKMHTKMHTDMHTRTPHTNMHTHAHTHKHAHTHTHTHHVTRCSGFSSDQHARAAAGCVRFGRPRRLQQPAQLHGALRLPQRSLGPDGTSTSGAEPGAYSVHFREDPGACSVSFRGGFSLTSCLRSRAQPDLTHTYTHTPHTHTHTHT